MAKGKVKKETKKHAMLTRKQRRAMEKSSSIDADPEDLNTQLKNLGLCTKNITGDGNCLFRSLSDQYYGQDGNHKAIRQEICQFLRENEETYQFFVEDDQSFEHHVECMSQNATFGGNMELAAFAKLKKVDIKVYQPGLIYVINGVDEQEQADDADDNEERQVLHIAYHSWEHYDSVRNLDGPYTGPPEIKILEKTARHDEPNAEEGLGEEDGDLDSKEKVVRNACPDASIRKIRRLLNKYKGDPDKVIDALYELENKSENKEEAPQDAAEETQTKDAMEQTASPTEQEENPEEQKTDPMEQKGDAVVEQAVESEEAKNLEEATLEETSVEPKATIPEEKPKKLSAAERKKEAKRRQKENKLMKERAKAARKAKYKQEKATENNEKPSTENTAQSMKEMYI